MRNPVFVQAIADAVGASSVQLGWASPDRDTPAPPPKTGLPAGRQYPDGEHYREIAGKLWDARTAMSLPIRAARAPSPCRKLRAEGRLHRQPVGLAAGAAPSRKKGSRWPGRVRCVPV